MTSDIAESLDFSGVDWSPHSFGDPGGRLFWHHNLLYRALRGQSTKAFLRMEEQRLIPRCVAWGLVSTRGADIALAGYDLFVEHEIIRPSPVVS